MCSFDNLACLVVTMWPTLEKLRCDVALLVGMQRHLWVACAMIAYLRDAWAQCLRENILGGSSSVQSGSHLFHVLSCLFLPKAMVCVCYWDQCTRPTQGDASPGHGLGLAKGC